VYFAMFSSSCRRCARRSPASARVTISS